MVQVRYVVVGAGAIGGTVGGQLAESGREVAFVARGEHGRILRQSGIVLASPDRTVRLSVPTYLSVHEVDWRHGDVVLLAVKSQDTQAVLAEFAAVTAGTRSAADSVPVYCFQNGIENERAALRLFTDVHGVSMRLPATHLKPGRVEAHSSPLTGLFEVGRYPSGIDDLDRQVSADLSSSGFAAFPKEDVMAWKRRKLLLNLSNALEVLCPAPLADAESIARLSAVLVDEGTACMAAAGLTLTSVSEWKAPPAEQMNDIPVDGRKRQGGSTWQSVTRGLGSVEVDFLNGEVVLLGRLHGVPTPVNGHVQSLMRALGHGGSVAPIDPREILAARPVRLLTHK
jgi:2-dehydropantoate 2-reductase